MAFVAKDCEILLRTVIEPCLHSARHAPIVPRIVIQTTARFCTDATSGGTRLREAGRTQHRRHIGSTDTQRCNSDTVGRTQVYLGTDELELLDRVAHATGASRSELIRRAVRSTFGQPTGADKLKALEVSPGSWRGRGFTGSEYIDSVRGDLDERLGRLGLE
jgi:hypothetical protein